MTNEELDRRERELRIKREELRLERSQKINGILNFFGSLGKLLRYPIIVIIPVLAFLLSMNIMFLAFKYHDTVIIKVFNTSLSCIIGIIVFFGLKKLMFSKK